MAEYTSYYNIKSLCSEEETTQFIENIHRKESVIQSCLLPLSVPSVAAHAQANIFTKAVARKLTVSSFYFHFIFAFRCLHCTK